MPSPKKVAVRVAMTTKSGVSVWKARYMDFPEKERFRGYGESAEEAVGQLVMRAGEFVAVDEPIHVGETRNSG